MSDAEKTESESSTASGSPDQRGLRKTRVGKVVSDKGQKTIVVEVERRVPHPRFKKIIKQKFPLFKRKLQLTPIRKFYIAWRHKE